MRDARIASEATTLDPITLEVIRGAGLDGIGAAGLRKDVSTRWAETDPKGKGIGGARVDASAKRLYSAGLIERRTDLKWRVPPMSGGSAK